jgi:hypothetical protein
MASSSSRIERTAALDYEIAQEQVAAFGGWAARSKRPWEP